MTRGEQRALRMAFQELGLAFLNVARKEQTGASGAVHVEATLTLSVGIPGPPGIKVKFEGREPHHHSPHVHAEADGRTGSYRIGDGECVAGGIERKYEKELQKWIKRHRKKLFKQWNKYEESRRPIVARLTCDLNAARLIVRVRMGGDRA